MLDLIYNYGLGTDDNGNVLGITNNKNTARNQTFTHETNFAPLNRLLTAQSGSAWGINFTGGIDAWGNLYQTGTISGTSTNPMSVNQSVNGKNQFTLLGYSYDAAGNVLADGSGSTACAGNAYTWNAEEEMTCALGSSYTYDGDGIRVKKTGGSATPTLYWGTGTLAESDTSGNLTSEYIFLNGRRIARRDVATGNVYYYFADELGSSNVLATSAGALENESDFYPFGGELPVTQNLTNQKYKFEGKERDPESASLAQPQGLDNFGARFDSSAMGRFMSPDWANSPEPVPYSKLGDPQTLNLYAFTLNNPESDPDLDGHQQASPPPSVDQFNQDFDQSMGQACGLGLATACSPSSPSTVEPKPFTLPDGPAPEVGPAVGEAVGEAVVESAVWGVASKLGAIGIALVLILDAQTTDPNEDAEMKAIHEADAKDKAAKEAQAASGGNKKGGNKDTKHGKQRAEEARAGDTHRQVGDANRVIRTGRQYTDRDTGNIVHVSGDRVVVTTAAGAKLTQFINSRANTQQRIADGRWVPK